MDVYASHLNTLYALGTLPIKRVLEFGAGNYSTPAFLNIEAFPHVEYVESWEDDPSWVAQLAQNDRHRIRAGESDDLARDADPSSFDLVFIDNGKNPTERLAVINRIVVPGVPYIIVIHDFEFPDYRTALIHGLSSWESSENPVTGVLWAGQRPHIIDALARA